MTLWRPNNRGYCYSKEAAGVYSALDVKTKINGDSLLFLPVESVEKMFVKRIDPDATAPTTPFGHMIPNTLANRKKLGIHYQDRELVIDEITVDTELTVFNYDFFFKFLDAEFIRQYPDQLAADYKHSETVDVYEWLNDCLGHTVQNIIDADVECWEE